jgi:hypothetical protein
VNFVVTLIALNLQLSVVYGVHTVNWTKYYLGGSFIASVGIMIPGGLLLFARLPARRLWWRGLQLSTMSGAGT